MSRTPPRGSGYRAVLSLRPFALLWAGQGVSAWGDALYGVALLWHVYSATGSALAAGALLVWETIGRLLGGLAAGALLDRLPLRRVMLLSDGLRLALTLGVGLAWLVWGAPSPPVLYGLGFCLHLSGAFFNPARAAAVPQIVPAERLVTANALDGVSSSITNTVAWGLSGAVVALVGPALSLLLDACTFGISALAVWAARWEGANVVAAAGGRPIREALGGVRWVRSSPLARVILGAALLHAVGAGAFVSGLAPLMRELGGGPGLYGAQGAAFGVGLFLASAVIGYRSAVGVGRLYAGGTILNGVGNTLFALAPSVPLLLGFGFAAGLGAPGRTTGERTLLQAHVPPAVRGRVFALSDLLATVVVGPAIAVGGWLCDRFGAREVLTAASLLHVGIGVALLALPGIREATVEEGV